MVNILVIDIGTSSMRGTVFSNDGVLICERRIKYSVIYGQNGIVEQNPNDWLDSLISITKELSKRTTIDAIAVTAQRSSVIPVNREGNPLRNAIMWQDTRNKAICEQLKGNTDFIFDKSGSSINTAFSGSKMTWIKKYEPEVYKKVHKFLNIPEFIMHCMTGNYHTDYTYGSRTHLMSIRDKKWDKDLLDLFDVEEHHLCTLKRPGEICGNVTKQFSLISGLQEGIPVISSGGDQQCATIGQGAILNGDASIVLGTGIYLTTITNEIPKGITNNIICNCSSIDGYYTLEANLWTGSSALDWFTNTFSGDSSISLAELDRELEAIYDVDVQCLALPFFQGRSTPDWNLKARASFFNISLSTKKMEMYKALVEGLCIEIYNNIVLMSKYVDIKKIYISGGLVNSNIINQIQADVYQHSLIRQINTETTSLGALIIATIGLGIYTSVDKAVFVLLPDIFRTKVTPNIGKSSYYQEKIRKTNDVYKKLYG